MPGCFDLQHTTPDGSVRWFISSISADLLNKAAQGQTFPAREFWDSVKSCKNRCGVSDWSAARSSLISFRNITPSNSMRVGAHFSSSSTSANLLDRASTACYDQAFLCRRMLVYPRTLCARYNSNGSPRPILASITAAG